MADTREKLVELIEQAYFCNIESLADYLIANGVTVQGDKDINVPTKCDYCQEDRDGYRKALGAFSITNPFHGNEWFVGTGHCKPRQIYFCPMCGREFPKKG